MRLFRTASARATQETSVDDNKATMQTLSVILERETVTLLRPAGASMVDADNRCLCCGQVVPEPLTVCAAHATAALPSTNSVSPARLQEPTPTNDIDEVK